MEGQYICHATFAFSDCQWKLETWRPTGRIAQQIRSAHYSISVARSDATHSGKSNFERHRHMNTSIEALRPLSFLPILALGVVTATGLVTLPILGVALLTAGIVYTALRKQPSSRRLVAAIILTAAAMLLLIAAFIGSIVSVSASDANGGIWLTLLACALVSLVGAACFAAGALSERSGQPLVSWLACIGAAAFAIALVALFLSVSAGVDIADAGRSTSVLDSLAIVSLITVAVSCVMVITSAIVGLRRHRRTLAEVLSPK